MAALTSYPLRTLQYALGNDASGLTGRAAVAQLAELNTFTRAQTITDATASTSTGTGALIVTGGVGIGGDLFVGATIQVSEILNDASGQTIRFNKQRAGAVVQSSDALGQALWYGWDGAAYVNAAQIQAVVDGTPGSNDMPTRLGFWVTGDGSSTLTERMRLDNNGQLIVGSNFTIPSGNQLNLVSDVNTFTPFALFGYNGTFANHLDFYRTAGANPNTFTLVGANENCMRTDYYLPDGAAYRALGSLIAAADGTPASGSMPGKLQFFTTPSSTTSPVERLRIAQGGAVYFIGVGTTATAANAFIDNSSTPVNSLLRSTSSLRYKTDVEPVESSLAEATLALKPIWFRSLAQNDNPDWSFYGLGAEDVAAVDPRLVQWSYRDSDYTDALDEQNGSPIKVRNPDAVLVPDGVMYDRVAILQIAALAAKVAALEARV